MIALSARRCWLAPRVAPPVQVVQASAAVTLGAWINGSEIRCCDITANGTTDQARLISNLCEFLTRTGRGHNRLVVRDAEMREVAVVEQISAGISRVEWW